VLDTERLSWVAKNSKFGAIPNSTKMPAPTQNLNFYQKEKNKKKGLSIPKAKITFATHFKGSV
jgi:hypothetical protein